MVLTITLSIYFDATGACGASNLPPPPEPEPVKEQPLDGKLLAVVSCSADMLMIVLSIPEEGNPIEEKKPAEKYRLNLYRRFV